ncbi:SDR family oxidoreductase [Arthrobacter sp. Bi83]|uniref:SDR family NAD(P)-dependent oxidoreductase n=1 Tax=Arthrobacter sp. Bi83 TaxID=2822353 RepID=UPI0025B6B17A|nr:SDR family oxidoreductase [Arthrobacter sp. Bi83]
MLQFDPGGVVWNEGRCVGIQPFGRKVIVHGHLGDNGVDRGKSVNAIAPGPVNTPMWAQFAKDSGPDATANRAKRAAQLPMRRFAEPDEVGRAILFLADPDNRYITGVTLDVAGGAHLGMGT